MIKFLFDEDVESDEIVGLAKNSSGYNKSTRINRLLPEGISDESIIAFAQRNNWVVVTKNVRHFRPKYTNAASHPGLVCFSSGCKNAQDRLDFFQKAIDEIKSQGITNLRNKIVSVYPVTHTKGSSVQIV